MSHVISPKSTSREHRGLLSSVDTRLCTHVKACAAETCRGQSVCSKEFPWTPPAGAMYSKGQSRRRAATVGSGHQRE